MSKHKQPLVLIIGPTAVGKSNLGVELAKKFNGEVISGDSMQVYRGMDIGTAKITVEERGHVPHHLIDIVNPDEEYSVASFQTKARKLIQEIHVRNKLPFIVGGTGLYIRAVIDDYSFTEEAVDTQLRAKFEIMAVELGPEKFHQYLTSVDAEAAGRIHPNDTKRIIRALEVNFLTGRQQNEYHFADQNSSMYDLAAIGLNMERSHLYMRIDQRTQNMVESGLVEEVKGLLTKGYGLSLTSMQAIGYKEIVSYLNGETSLEDAIELIQRNTRRFAKRQLTWFRKDPRIRWFDVTSEDWPNLYKETAHYIQESLNVDPVC